jgi:O-antigen ligase
LLPIAWQNPVLGAGLRDLLDQADSQFDPRTVNEAHNGYLDVFIELGIVGLILVALVVWMYFRKAKNELGKLSLGRISDVLFGHVPAP